MSRRIAAERTAGGYRLWLATDDNFHPRLGRC